jgi:AAA family ATPase
VRECTCEAGAACVLLFMDEVDALCPDRDGREVASTSEQTRLVATLLTLLDGVGKEREGGDGRRR